MRKFNLLIEREVREEINKYIIEALTVNDEVLEASKKVEDYILANIKNVKRIPFANGGGKRELSFSLQLFNDNISVAFNVTNFNFKDETYYNKYAKNHGVGVSSTSCYKRSRNIIFAMCNINYISFDFMPLGKFYEDLHHELNHILQQNKLGGTYTDSASYATITADIFSEDEVKHNVAEILYLCRHTEQDCFVSSVYSFVKNEFHIDWNYKYIDDCIKDTDAYKRIYRMKAIYNEIINNKEEYEKLILTERNFKTWAKFEKYVTESLKRFEKKFAMVVKKCKTDFVIYEKFTWVDASCRNQMYLINF